MASHLLTRILEFPVHSVSLLLTLHSLGMGVPGTAVDSIGWPVKWRLLMPSFMESVSKHS